MVYQDMIAALQDFWRQRGCVMVQPWNSEVGAGTFNPATFLRALGPEPWRVAYVEPSKRPKDGRYLENPNRVHQFLQYQVLLKPNPADSQELYLESLRAMGIEPGKHDIRFVEDDWESPTLGAAGLGWEVWLDGMEISQFTYFQQVGGVRCKPVAVELTYGLLRIAMFLQDCDHVKDLQWGGGLTWGEVMGQFEKEYSAFNFEHADVDLYRRHFEDKEREAARLLEAGLVYPWLRRGHPLQPHVQPARGPRRHLGDRAHGLHRPGPQPGPPGSPGLRQEPRGPGVPPARQGGPARMSHPIERRPFVLEIGSEEIPARFTPTAMAEVEARLTDLLSTLHLDHDPLRVLATPRRLVVLCDALAVHQPDREETVKGPPVSVAFDAEGGPTAAGEGFSRKTGVPLADCERAEDQRGAFLVARRALPGRQAADVLGEHLADLVLGLPFRKTMRWGDLELEYARPLQWLLCLHGEAVVPFSVGPLTSGRTTRGHRTLSGDARGDVPAAGAYLSVVECLGIMPDPEQRRQTILEQAEALLAVADEPGTLRVDDDLLGEVVHLCEFPTAFLGTFAPEFFELPDEVIITALKSHQRYFTVEDPATGRLRPRFLAVRDGGREHLANVTAGNERVLRARLADALFYWRFDQQKSPAEHAAGLAKVTWIEGFGSVADQTRRSARLADLLWRAGLGEGPPPAELARAAALSRFDLVTEMIKDGKEFTRLEGVIAARYAAVAGEPAAVCQALEQSQLPRSAQGELPDDPISRVMSMAWRLDTLAGCWLAGFAPTGAKDPYALRRHTLAILRLILAADVRVDLRELLAAALAPHGEGRNDLDLEVAGAELLDFILVRLSGWLQEAEGIEPDVVRAVLAVRGHDPADARAWMRALAGFRTRDDFLRLARGFKRCANILKGEVLDADARVAAVARWRNGGQGAGGESFAELHEPAEAALRDAVVGVVSSLLDDESRRDYVAVFQRLSGLGPFIDRFFDEVRVNVDDLGLRALRTAFLRDLQALFMRFADFAQVAPDDQ